MVLGLCLMLSAMALLFGNRTKASAAEEAAQTDDQALYHFYHLYPQAPEHAGACRGRNRQAPDILALHPTDSPQGFAWASKTTG